MTEPAKRNDIQIFLNPLLADWIDELCPPWQSRTSFTNDLVHSALLGLTPCATMGTAKPLAGSRYSLVLDQKIRNEEINHPQGSRAVTPEDSKETAKAVTSNARARETKPKNQYGKKLDPEVIPEDLQHCADAIVEFWAVKKGTRSEGAAMRLFNKLMDMSNADRLIALHRATDSGWATVYEPQPEAPAQRQRSYQPEEPQFKHPAHRVFTAADFNCEPMPGNVGVLEQLAGGDA